MSATQINMERETMFKWKKMALEQENQVELLRSFVKHHQECIELCRERENKLKAQNEIIKKLLIKSKQFIYHLKDCASHSYDDCDCGSEEAEIEIHKILKELKEV
jgi:hypothetical protein